MTRKRPVKLRRNEDLVQQAKGLTDSLSGVVEEQEYRLTKTNVQVATTAWKDFNSKQGSFADEYSPL